MSSSTCVTTVVFGKEYQSYIPFLLLSLLKSYPEYKPIIFIYESLDKEIGAQLPALQEFGDFEIVDEYFNEFKNLNIFQGKSLRWILRDYRLMKFDYVYFIDIDILYFREVPSLHMQHLIHMDSIGYPFSNTKRIRTTINRSYRIIGRRLQKFGIVNAIENFIKGTVTEDRLTGLHFVRTQDYFPKVQLAQENVQKMLNSGKYLKTFQGFSDEAVLFYICEKSGFNLSGVGEYSDHISLDYKKFKEPYFRPHHGIHLGIFREKDTMSSINTQVANSEVYHYYLEQYKLLRKEPLFMYFLNNSDNFLKNQFLLLEKFYGLNKFSI